MIALLAQDPALARPLIDHYHLVRLPLRSSFALYRSRPGYATDDIALAVSGRDRFARDFIERDKIAVAAATGYLFGLRGAESAEETGLIAGLFRFPPATPTGDFADRPAHPVAVVVRAVDADRSTGATVDTLFRHSLPEITIESPHSAVPAFMEAALAWTGPHRIVALCADPEAAGAKDIAGTVAAVIAAAVEAASPPGSAAARAGRVAAVRVGTILRLSRTRQARLAQLLGEYASRHGGSVPELAQLSGGSYSRLESARIFSDLERLLEQEIG